MRKCTFRSLIIQLVYFRFLRKIGLFVIGGYVNSYFWSELDKTTIICQLSYQHLRSFQCYFLTLTRCLSLLGFWNCLDQCALSQKIKLPCATLLKGTKRPFRSVVMNTIKYFRLDRSRTKYQRLSPELSGQLIGSGERERGRSKHNKLNFHNPAYRFNEVLRL